jgi:hypothetical protein
MQEWRVKDCGCSFGHSDREGWAKFKQCALHYYAPELRESLEALLSELEPDPIPDHLVNLIASAKDAIEKTRPELPFEPPEFEEPL